MKTGPTFLNDRSTEGTNEWTNERLSSPSPWCKMKMLIKPHVKNGNLYSVHVRCSYIHHLLDLHTSEFFCQVFFSHLSSSVADAVAASDSASVFLLPHLFSHEVKTYIKRKDLDKIPYAPFRLAFMARKVAETNTAHSWYDIEMCRLKL